MDTTAAHHSDALVDYSGLSKTLGDLEHAFSLLEFLDLCAVIEGIVLHDRLVMVGGGSMVSEDSNRESPLTRVAPRITAGGGSPSAGLERWRNLVKPLVDAGVLVSAPPTAPGNPGPKPESSGGERDFNARAFSQPRFAPTLARSTELDSWYEAGRLLGAEQQLGCPPLALIRQRPYYQRGGQARPRHTVCDLMGQYQNLSAALSALRSRTRLALTPFLVVPIPALPLIVLRLCSSYDDILPRALDIRDDYADLRASLRTLRETLADDTQAPRKKLALIASWQRSWETLRKYDRGSSYVELAGNALDIPDLNSAIEGVGLNALRLTDLLKFAVTKGANYFNSWRVRLLHNVARRYLATPDSELGEQVERLFKARVTADQLQMLHSRWGSIGSVDG